MGHKAKNGAVYNHGTEDRPTARKLPGSTKSLGWVRFRTESIESLSLVENYTQPGIEPEPQEDPILASVVSSNFICTFFLHPFMMKYFSDVNCLRAHVRERKNQVDISVAFLLNHSHP